MGIYNLAHLTTCGLWRFSFANRIKVHKGAIVSKIDILQPRKMISISSIQFDTQAWKKIENSPQQISWSWQNTAIITLHYFGEAPKLGFPLTQIDDLRRSYREEAAKAGAGIVSLELIKVQNLDCIEAIFKLPQKPHGMTYFASLTFPFSQFSFVIKIECPETGTTGTRDAVIAARCMASEAVEIDTVTMRIHGWAEDPYDPKFAGPALRNKADDEKHDAEFPQHPLSRARRILSELKSSIRFSEETGSSKPFLGPENSNA